MAGLDTVGDPEAMRALARELSARADLITQAAGRSPVSRMDESVFDGPAADRARSTGKDISGQLTKAAADLTAIARSLVIDAGKVELLNEQARRLAASDQPAPSPAPTPTPPPAAAAPPPQPPPAQPPPTDPAQPPTDPNQPPSSGAPA